MSYNSVKFRIYPFFTIDKDQMVIEKVNDELVDILRSKHYNNSQKIDLYEELLGRLKSFKEQQGSDHQATPLTHEQASQTEDTRKVDSVSQAVQTDDGASASMTLSDMDISQPPTARPSTTDLLKTPETSAGDTPSAPKKKKVNLYPTSRKLGNIAPVDVVEPSTTRQGREFQNPLLPANARLLNKSNWNP